MIKVMTYHPLAFIQDLNFIDFIKQVYIKGIVDEDSAVYFRVSYLTVNVP